MLGREPFFNKVKLALKGLGLLKEKELTPHAKKRLLKKEAGLRYHLACLRRHRQKMKAQRRKASKQARISRRINRGKK